MNADQWYVSKSEKTEAIPRFRACVGLWNSEFGFAPSRCRFDESQQVRVSLDRFELRKLFPDVLRRAKQEADIRLPEHGGVIIGIAHSDDVVIQTSEGNDGFFLLIADAEPIIDDAIANNLQLMAKESGPFQLPEQGSGKLLEGIRKNDDRRAGAQFTQELERAVQGTQSADDALNVREFQAA